MKLQCKEPGCGTVIQTSATDDGLLAKSLLEKHVEVQHGSLEARQSKTLSKCYTILTALSLGHKISRDDAKQAAGEVSDLLKIPRQN